MNKSKSKVKRVEKDYYMSLETGLTIGIICGILIGIIVAFK